MSNFTKLRIFGKHMVAMLLRDPIDYPDGVRFNDFSGEAFAWLQADNFQAARLKIRNSIKGYYDNLRRGGEEEERCLSY